MYSITIPGVPVSDNSKLSKRALLAMSATFRQFWGVCAPLSDPIDLRMVFYMPMPPSWASKRRRDAQGKYVTTAPALSWLEGQVIGCGHETLWQDAALISCLSSTKVYSTKPRTLIEFDLAFP